MALPCLVIITTVIFALKITLFCCKYSTGMFVLLVFVLLQSCYHDSCYEMCYH